MDTFYKTLPKRIPTKTKGIYYKEIEKTTIDNSGKSKTTIDDKVFYIRYKDLNQKDTWEKIGKYSEGIREAYCSQKRTEVMNQLRLGEQPTVIKRKARKKIITFDSIAQPFFEYKKMTIRDSKNYISRYDNHIKEKFGDMDIGSITTKDILKLQNKKSEELENKTVNHITQTIGSIFNYAIKHENLSIKNPVVGLKPLDVDNARERYLKHSEIEKLYDALKDNSVLTLFVQLSLTTGGRVSTIMNIKKKDIDIENKTINLFDFKNNTSYIGFFNDALAEQLQKHIKDLKMNDSVIEYCRDTVASKLSSVIDTLFNEGLEKNDAKNRAVIHTLRHTFASHLAINGTPIYTIKKLMNHKTIQTTMRYAKLAPDCGREMVEGLYQ